MLVGLHRGQGFESFFFCFLLSFLYVLLWNCTYVLIVMITSLSIYKLWMYNVCFDGI